MIFDDVVLPVVQALIERDLGNCIKGWEIDCTLNEIVHGDKGGKKFINIYPTATVGGPSAETQEQGFDYHDGFAIGISYRTGQVPLDRMWKGILGRQHGPIEVARNISMLLRANRIELQGLINAALTTAGIGMKIVEPYRLVSGVAAFREVTAAHFNASPNSSGRHSHGIWTVLEFSQGRYMGTFEDVTYCEEIIIDESEEAPFDCGFSLGFESPQTCGS